MMAPRVKHWLLAALLLWTSSGCYLPIQQTPPDSRAHYPTSHDQFVPGETSRADVLLAMGEPDAVAADEAILTYRWSRVDGIIVITQCTPPVEVGSETIIEFTFDDDGVLRSVDATVS